MKTDQTHKSDQKELQEKDMQRDKNIMEFLKTKNYNVTNDMFRNVENLDDEFCKH